MLFIHSTDTFISESEIKKICKVDTAECIRVYAEEITQEYIDAYLYGQSLFGGSPVIIIDSIEKNQDIYHYALDRLNDFLEADSLFIFLTEDKTLLSYAKEKKILVSSVKEDKKVSETTNPFILSDFIFTRNKKEAWIAFQTLKAKGVVAREIHTVLFWAFKTMASVHVAPTAEEARVKPFVFSKAKASKTIWDYKQLQYGLKALTTTFHTDSFDEDAFSFVLEKFILKTL